VLALAIYFEKRHECGRQHKTERWRSLVRAFAVDHVYVIDRVGLPCFEPDFPSFDHITHLDEINFDGKMVYVDNVCPPNRTMFDLPDFRHPVGDVCYVVGADALGIADVNHTKESEYEGLWLKIPTSTHHGIWAEQAAAIVLAHRKLQHADH
jgi:hypothetical protein